MYTTLQDIFACAGVCKSLVACSVASILSTGDAEFSDSCSTNYCYLRPASPARRGRTERERACTHVRKEIKTYHYAAGLQTRLCAWLRFENASVRFRGGALLSHFGSLLFRTTGRSAAVSRFSVGKRLAVCRQIHNRRHKRSARANAFANERKKRG